MPLFVHRYAAFVFFVGCAITLSGQTAPAAAPDPPAAIAPTSSVHAPTPTSPKPSSSAENEIERQEQSQRLLGVIPNFGTTSRQDAPPLSGRAKFRLFYKSAFDPVELSVVGLQAGVSQAEDEFPEYGQGAAGFGKRYGATLADEVSSGFFANYFYPVLLKE